MNKNSFNVNATRSSNKSNLDDLDSDSEEPVPSSSREGESTEIYKNYDFKHKSKVELPIFSSKERILNLIEDNSVIILQGETGCGKTTQVPQFILDNARERNEFCNIVVTQPRRIAAISIANRVCNERQWDVGKLVGYQVALKPCTSPDTRLLYCTTGVLLQKLIKTKNLGQYTHIILDEVHERDNEMDFLMIVIKKLLSQAIGNVKLILMSATIEAHEVIFLNNTNFSICI